MRKPSKSSILKAQTAAVKLFMETVDVADKKMQPHLIRGLKIVYNNQTADEKQTKSTRLNNGKGFSGSNAQFGSSLMEQYTRNGKLSVKQYESLRKMLHKHARQLAIDKINRQQNELTSPL